MNNTYNDTITSVFSEVRYEIGKAKEKHGDDPFSSYHEAYAVVLEEVDELWEEVKRGKFDKVACRKEAIQSAAMIVRFIAELL